MRISDWSSGVCSSDLLASILRQQGYEGGIVLVGDEAYVPYRRPPLSKTFLSGEATLESMFIKPQALYAQHTIECRFGTGVELLDRPAHNARLFAGTNLESPKQVWATAGPPPPHAR